MTGRAAQVRLRLVGLLRLARTAGASHGTAANGGCNPKHPAIRIHPQAQDIGSIWLPVGGAQSRSRHKMKGKRPSRTHCCCLPGCSVRHGSCCKSSLASFSFFSLLQRLLGEAVARWAGAVMFISFRHVLGLIDHV